MSARTFRKLIHRFLLISSFFFFLIACSQTERTAKLLNGYVTGVQFNADLSPSTSEIKTIPCGGESYEVFEATGSIKGAFNSKSSVKATIEVSFTLSDPTKARAGTTPDALVCKFQADWDWDSEKTQMRGGGSITACDTLDYSCKIGSSTISCEELKAALQKFKCNG